MIEQMIRLRRTRKIRGVLLALLALGALLLLALLSAPSRAATTFIVNSTGDGADINLTNIRCDASSDVGDQCTLRAAIEEANDTAGADTIEFDIAGSTNLKTISPTSELPTITDALTIDGYTQAGASPNTLEEGNDADLNVQLDGLNAGVNVVGLQVDANDCTIKGLIIKRFSSYGVSIESSGTGNSVEGNFIGVKRDGITDQGNSSGVRVQGDSSTVGGTESESRNVISGNDGYGVFVANVSTDTKVEGNYIGTTADGTDDLGNTGDGVSISSASNTVGGTEAGAGNVISGNDENGIFVVAGATENRIEGNYIGTTASGNGDLGNTGDGVFIKAGPDFTAVGGTAPGAANQIAHNGGDGVSITESTSAGSASPTVGNHILSNRIFNNGELGIDLVGGTEDANGVTANDTDDPNTTESDPDKDTGPNNLQNFPIITSAKTNSKTRITTISGTLFSTPTTSTSFHDFVIECFLTGGAPASAYGEGSRLIDTVVVSTDANGNAKFTCTSSLRLLGTGSGRTVSATATDVVTGDTSEFSKNRAITTVP